MLDCQTSVIVIITKITGGHYGTSLLTDLYSGLFNMNLSQKLITKDPRPDLSLGLSVGSLVLSAGGDLTLLLTEPPPPPPLLESPDCPVRSPERVFSLHCEGPARSGSVWSVEQRPPLVLGLALGVGGRNLSAGKHFLPTLRADSLVLQQPGVDTLHMVGVVTRQDPQLVTKHVVVKTDTAGLVAFLVSNFKFLSWDFLQRTLGQPVPSLPPAILNAFEDHYGQHDEETDANHYGKGQKVGIYIKRSIVSDSNNIISMATLEGVLIHQSDGVRVANEDTGDKIRIAASHWDELIISVVVNNGCTVVCLHGSFYFVFKSALIFLLVGV